MDDFHYTVQNPVYILIKEVDLEEEARNDKRYASLFIHFGCFCFASY